MAYALRFGHYCADEREGRILKTKKQTKLVNINVSFRSLLFSNSISLITA